MNFVLMHQSILTNDAIGHDLLEMRRVLTRNHKCYVFGEYVTAGGCQAINANRAGELLSDPQTVVIYHHSIAWPLGEDLLSSSRARIVFKYHNITPPNYFADVPAYRTPCLAGHEQTYRFINRFPEALWLSDSLYSLQEIGVDKVVHHRVVPPFLNIKESRDLLPNEVVLQRLIASSELNVFSVGRIVPNKGHLFLIDVMEAYRRKYDDRFTFYVAGKRDDACCAYYDRVMAAVAAAELQNTFSYLNEVSSEVLLSYYLGCDAYICCSEHEGFCVPVVESQCMSLPLVARARGAVPETIGQNYLLHGEDPESYADTLWRLRSDETFREGLIQAGRRNYLNRFTHAQIVNAFATALDDCLGNIPI